MLLGGAAGRSTRAQHLRSEFHVLGSSGRHIDVAGVRRAHHMDTQFNSQSFSNMEKDNSIIRCRTTPTTHIPTDTTTTLAVVARGRNDSPTG